MKRIFAGMMTCLLMLGAVMPVSADEASAGTGETYKDQFIDLLLENEHREEGPGGWYAGGWGDFAARYDEKGGGYRGFSNSRVGKYPTMYFLDVDNDGENEFIINDDGYGSVVNEIWVYDIDEGELSASNTGIGRDLDVYVGDDEYLVLNTYDDPFLDDYAERNLDVTITREAVLEKNSADSRTLYSKKPIAYTSISNVGNKENDSYIGYEAVKSSMDGVEYTRYEEVKITEEEYKQLKNDLIGNKTKAELRYDLIQAKDFAELSEQEKRDVLSKAYDSSTIVIPGNEEPSDNSETPSDNTQSTVNETPDDNTQSAVSETPDDNTQSTASDNSKDNDSSNSDSSTPKSPATGYTSRYVGALETLLLVSLAAIMLGRKKETM